MAEYIRTDELLGLLGDQATMTLVYSHGGTQVFVPAHAPTHHWLSQLIGPEAADKLCAHFAVTSAGGRSAGATVELPRPSCKLRRMKFRKLDDQGLSAADIARQLGLSARCVRQYRRLDRELRA